VEGRRSWRPFALVHRKAEKLNPLLVTRNPVPATVWPSSLIPVAVVDLSPSKYPNDSIVACCANSGSERKFATTISAIR
jgi:hypothetical protein